MSGSGDSSGSTSRLTPVLAFPSQLDFYTGDQTTHKRVVTIYNPCDFEVKFKVLCNNPKNYAVVEPEGVISGQKCADLVVRHVAISPETVGKTDKFRVHIYDAKKKDNLLGRRDILATLHQGKPDPSDESHSLPHHAPPSPSDPSLHDLQSYNDRPSYGLPQQQQPNLIACLAALVCIFSLFLPTEGDSSTTSNLFKDYPWLHLTVNQKLVFAYVLGLVTMALLRNT